LELDQDELKEVMHLIHFDKKNENDTILMALITEIGHCNWDVQVSPELIEKAVKAHS
jgi:3-dehydroquinate synthetase